jgi:hypothetical protein
VEAAIITLLEHKEKDVRMAVLDLLLAFGTTDSIPALEKHVNALTAKNLTSEAQAGRIVIKILKDRDR